MHGVRGSEQGDARGVATPRALTTSTTKLSLMMDRPATSCITNAAVKTAYSINIMAVSTCERVIMLLPKRCCMGGGQRVRQGIFEVGCGYAGTHLQQESQ